MTAARSDKDALQSLGFLFLASILYSTALCMNVQWLEIVVTIGYVLISSFLLLRIAKLDLRFEAKTRWWFLPSVVACAPIGILLPAWVSGQARSFFWVSDSVSTHVPNAVNFASWLGGQPWFTLSGLDTPGSMTHFWVGLFFWIFGESAVVSLLALTLLKIATCFLIASFAKGWFQSRLCRNSYFAYLIAPNILFYTATFYKEAMIHLLLACALLALQRFWRKPSIWPAFCFVAPLIGLFIERFYLGLLLTPLLPLLAIWALKRRAIIPAVVMATCLAAAIYHQPYLRFSPERILVTLKDFREAHQRFQDIRPEYNYDIAYPLAVLKIALTPIWAPNKIDLFRGFSSILTWGSFINQLIILAYFLGIYRAIRSQGFRHLIIQLPFFVFLLLAAYISPWAGRIRDSFYPLIASYAFFYIVNYARQDLENVRAWRSKLFKPRPSL